MKIKFCICGSGDNQSVESGEGIQHLRHVVEQILNHAAEMRILHHWIHLPPTPTTAEATTNQILLYQAAQSGDWETAKRILDDRPSYGCARITQGGESLLHIAAMGKYTSFVRNLVNMLEESELELENNRGCTALYYAVLSGVVENAKVMCEKNHRLPTIRGYDRMIPINQAALLGHKEMVSYLYHVTPFKKLTERELVELLDATIRNDMYGMHACLLPTIYLLIT